MGAAQSSWVLLAAGSKDWINYRHQACVCHAYQMVHENHIPDERVVVMMYDDIAYNEKNKRHRGEIINEPDGPNVYLGVPKDYTEDDVSVDNFLAVLRGDENGVTKKAGGRKKVLKSGKNDTIFIYLSGHGGKGVFSFPGKDLHASDLIGTINEMSRLQKFSKLVIYVESCCSGSMIADLPKNAQVYGVSATTPDEPSYACFYDEERHTFLSNEFTSHWLFHCEMSDLTRTTFQDQFEYLREKVTRSTPCQYGNKELSQMFISNVLGCSDHKTRAAHASKAETFRLTHLTPSHEVLPVILRNQIQKEMDPEKWKALEKENIKLLQARIRTEKAVQDIAKLACPERGPRAVMNRQPLTRLDDIKVVAEHFRGTYSRWHEEQDYYSVLSHMHVFVSLVESGVKVDKIVDAITRSMGPVSAQDPSIHSSPYGFQVFLKS